MAIDLLNLSPHKVSTDLGGYITFIYGDYKTGKSTLASHMPNPVLIATEPGYNALPGVYAQDVTNWSEMRQVYKQLKQPAVRAKFDSIVIDTVDVAAEMCQRYICTQKDVESLSALPYGQGWTLFKNEFNEIFRGLAQLGYAVMFIGHSKEQTIGNDNNSRIIIRSALSNSTREIIQGMADIVGYAYQVSRNEMSHLMLRSPNDSVSCGTRFKYMPNDIVLSYDNLAQALGNAIEKEALEHNNQFVTSERMSAIADEHVYDYDAMMAEFQSMVQALMSQNQSNSVKITTIVDKYLGKGKKVSECTPNQCEQIELINLDLKELLS